MLHIIHMIERRFSGNRNAILLGLVQASVGVMALGVLMLSR